MARLSKWVDLARRATAAALAAAVVPGSAGPAIAQRSPETSLDIDVEVAGTMLIDGEETPVKLVAAEPTKFRVVASNKGGDPQEVVGLRFEGKVVGIPVFRCDVLAPFIVPGGETVERAFELEAACLRDQATGLVPASVTVHGPRQVPLQRWYLVLDIEGSLKSIYGLTGIFVVAMTVFALIGLLAALIRQRLPRNRFSRALRFTTVGIGIGFSLVFVLATAAVMVPDAENWIPVVVVPVVVFTIGGYLSPAPHREAEAAAEIAEATAVMQQVRPGAEPTAQLSPTAPRLPGQPGSGPVTAGGPGAPTAGAPPATALPHQTPPPSIPTKKVRRLPSVDESQSDEGGDNR